MRDVELLFDDSRAGPDKMTKVPGTVVVCRTGAARVHVIESDTGIELH